MKQKDPFSIVAGLKDGCKNFFTADMSSGYFQLKLEDGPEGSGITAFMCELGIFEWLVVPMGMQPSSDGLSRQMMEVFKELFAPETRGGAAAGASMVRDLDDFLEENQKTIGK